MNRSSSRTPDDRDQSQSSAGARSLRFRLIGIFALAVAYFVTGRLGLLLAIPPGYATAIWPPSGIALCALLVYGRGLWPGVLLGSFAVNAVVSSDLSTALTLVRSVGISASIAGGAALQAWLGTTLIRARVGFPHALSEGRDVLRFLALGGPVACSVNAVVGPGVLLLSGAFAPGALITNCLTWWSGDVLGVVVLVPVLLTFFGRPLEIWKPRRRSLALPMAAVVLVAILVFIRTSSLEQSQIQAQFQERVLTLERAVSDRLETHLQLLQSTRDFFGASREVVRDEFRRYVMPTLRSRPGLLAMEWVPRISRAERDSLEHAAHLDGLAGWRVRVFPGEELERPLYYPIFYGEPMSRVQPALGLDLGSEPGRRAALEKARDLGVPTASSRVRLALTTETTDGILLLMPLYAGEGVPRTVEQRREGLRGFVVGVLQLDELVQSAIGPPRGREISVSIEDITTGSGASTLYAEPNRSAPKPLVAAALQQIGGRRWRLSFSSTAAYLAEYRSWQAWAVLAAALLFGGLLGAFLLVLTGRNAQLERTSHEATQLLATIVQSSHDPIISYDPQGRIATWNSGAEKVFQWAASEVIGESFAKCLPEPALAEHRTRLAQVMAGEVLPTYETLRETKSGQALEVAVKLSPIYDMFGGVRGASEICRDISAEKNASRLLRASLREKELLLKEIHHRVKNNLQVISSLLSLQAEHVETPGFTNALAESQARIQAIALVHDQLYRSRDLAQIDFAGYVRELLQSVLRVQNQGVRVTSKVTIDDVRLGVDAAIPCGLIVNELVTNALKHAFPNRAEGQIEIALKRSGADAVKLCVADDGVGLPENFDPRQCKTLGLELVYTFAEQLEAQVQIQRGPGTAFHITFSV
ncbi:MAG TPA: CHASE domain-containing protein [Polyangiaceae bacterium]|nr:CHASE domain-containing protein [Polyangiaceae bacterium]